MTTAITRAELLMKGRMPFDLRNPYGLYERLQVFLNKIGQADGYWTEAGQTGIPALFPESKLSERLQQEMRRGFIARASQTVVSKFSRFGSELVMMARLSGFEFANGWVLFPIATDETEGAVEWFVSGMLFPPFDGQTEGWVVWATAAEVLG